MQFLDAKLLSQAITLSGKDLDIPSVIAVARYGANVKINKNTKISIQRCRDVVEIVVENDMVVYGISTGFGALRSHVIPQEKAIELQRNLIRSHACGVGEPLSAEIVRAAILLRANTLAKGNSGIRVVVIEKLLDMLSKGICPLVPSQGSVGASGDLCPLSHIALVLIGDPAGQFAVWNPKGKMALKDVYRSENVMSSTPENLRSYGYTPLELSYKEGLALNNGTQIMSAIACFVMYDSYWTLHAAELAACLSFEGIQAVGTALDERIHLVRPLPEQGRVSARLRKYLEGSVNMSSPINSGLLYRYAQYIQKNTNIAQKDRKVFASQIQKIIEKETESIAQNPHSILDISHNETALKRGKKYVQEILDILTQNAIPTEELLPLLHKLVPENCPTQDDYSFRCTPQVLGAAWQAWRHAHSVLCIEINSATDNPLIFPPEPSKNDKTPYRQWLQENLEKCRNAVISGGNFHGEPIGMVLDYLSIALAEVASISERRTAHLVDSNHNNGLPSFLMESPGVHSGFMIPQYTAAALVSENKILCHPATIDSIPTSANTEDHVSMATIASRKCLQILQNLTHVIAIEILTSNQAVGFRMLPLGDAAQKMQKFLVQCKSKKLPQGISHFKEDQVWYVMIQEIADKIRNQDLVRKVGIAGNL